MAKEKETCEVKTPYQILHEIDVRPYVIDKQGLSYLGWSYVYEFFNQCFSDWEVIEIDDERTGNNYFTDGKYAWVKVAIRIGEQTKTCSLPVMDNRNKSIPLENINSFDVNDALQRCKVKCAAYWGLGTCIYDKLNNAIAKLQQARNASELNEVMNKFKDLWNNETFVEEGKRCRAKFAPQPQAQPTDNQQAVIDAMNKQ